MGGRGYRRGGVDVRGGRRLGGIQSGWGGVATSLGRGVRRWRRSWTHKGIRGWVGRWRGQVGLDGGVSRMGRTAAGAGWAGLAGGRGWVQAKQAGVSCILDRPAAGTDWPGLSGRGRGQTGLDCGGGRLCRSAMGKYEQDGCWGMLDRTAAGTVGVDLA